MKSNHKKALEALQVTPTDIAEFKARVEAEILMRQREGRWTGGIEAHAEYQKNPIGWMVDKLGIPEHTIRWSLNPEYQACHCETSICNTVLRVSRGSPAHIWDGDVDPLAIALDRLAQGKSLSIASGTTLSKTHTIGAAGTLWFLACFKNAIVLSVAPKQEQLLLNMWKEIGRFWQKFKTMFPKADILTGKLRMLEAEGEQEVWAATAFAAGVGADEEFAQRLKGFHSPKMLWIIEEMPGVDQAKIDTIIKTATADFNPIVGMGQPTHQHDTLTNFGKRDWVKAVRMSAYDYPNVVCDREVIPGGRSKWSVARDLQDAGGDENDAGFLSQVRGIAPAQSSRALIRREWCEAAAKRQSDKELRHGGLSLGVDVADSPTGDESAISRWQGACCTEVVAFRAADASEVGRRVYQEMITSTPPISPRNVGVDYVGVGASTINELKRLGMKVRAIGTKTIQLLDTEEHWSKTRTVDGKELPAGAKVVEAERYANTRSQIYWRLREDLRLGRIALPDDPLLFEELTAMEYEEVNDKIIVAPKDELRVKLRRSPDRADSVVYGNWVRPRVPLRETPQAVETSSSQDTGLEEFLDRHTRQERIQQRQFEKNLKRKLKERRRGRA